MIMCAGLSSRTKPYTKFRLQLRHGGRQMRSRFTGYFRREIMGSAKAKRSAKTVVECPIQDAAIDPFGVSRAAGLSTLVECGRRTCLGQGAGQRIHSAECGRSHS